MDPISAFSLAAGIMQVVDFSTRLLSTANQLYHDGSTIRNSDFTLVADDLSSLNDKVKARARPDLSVSGPLAKDNQALENLTEQITTIADELSLTLLRVRTKSRATAFESFKAAVLTMWNKSKVEETVQRLQTIREEIQFHIIVSMREKVDSLELRTDATLQSLDNSTRVIVESILQGNTNLATIVDAQTFESIKREHAREAAAIKRHDEMTAKIDRLPLLVGSDMLSTQPLDTVQVLRRIKNCLDFPQNMDRYDLIKPAHQKTFTWIFQEASRVQQPWANLGTWLHTTKSGVYWVSGKAGSGKSTLMKYLTKDVRLKRALQSWAGDIPLIVMSFYFWNPGHAMQKSQEGLFRTLLLQVLEAMPDLGPVLFPERYEASSNWAEFPTFHQLRRAFEQLTTQSRIPVKIALVIDGLDEFEPTDAVRGSRVRNKHMFLNVTQSANIKAVLSSRPLSAFEASFANCPRLRLHELTKHDIEIFVSDHLGQHPRIIELSQDDAAGVESLIQEIVSAASGVFFWVKLAVDSLLEGFRNYDELADLRLRLKAIPRDLEDFFMRMLKQIPPEYKIQSSRMFQLVRCTERVQDTIVAHVPARALTPIYGNLRLLTGMTMYFAEFSLDKILEAPINQVSDLEMARLIKEVDGRLRSRCRGLLEVRHNPISNDDPEVQYLHRSVADWLKKGHVWAAVAEGTKGTDYNPYALAVQAFVMRLKCLSTCTQDQPRVHDFLKGHWEYVNAITIFARASEQITGRTQDQILDELDRVMSIYYETACKQAAATQQHLYPTDSATWGDTIREDYIRPIPYCDTFFAFAIRHGLQRYVQAKIGSNGGLLPNKKGRPLLDYACRLEPSYPNGVEVINLAIVECLLEHGADPNEKFKRFSPWQNALYAFASDPTRCIPILKVLIKYGADVQASIEMVERDHRPVAEYTGGRSPAPYHHLRKSALLVLQGCMAVLNTVGVTANVKDELLEVMQILEKKGAKAEEYWAQEPGAPSVFSRKRDKVMEDTDSAAPSAKAKIELLLGGTQSSKVREVSLEEKELPQRRIRRYLNRLSTIRSGTQNSESRRY